MHVVGANAVDVECERDDYCSNFNAQLSRLLYSLHFCRDGRAGGGGRGFGSDASPPPFSLSPPSNPGCSHYSWPCFPLANQLTAAAPPLFSIPYMPLLLNEQSRLTPSAERKPVRTQEGKESAGWKEGPENRGRQERGEKEEEWQDREGGAHGERLLYS